MRANKEGVIFLCVVVILSGIVLYIIYIKKDRIKEKGLYQIATVFKKGQAKNGTVYHFMYKYKDISYTGTYLSSGLDSLFIIKLLPENPNEWIVVFKQLPPCITSKDATSEGWEKLPANCN